LEGKGKGRLWKKRKDQMEEIKENGRGWLWRVNFSSYNKTLLIWGNLKIVLEQGFGGF